jgi:hypothetical protein
LQPPQFWVSADVFLHCPLHAENPLAHEKPHAELVHVADEFWGFEQATAHAEQLLGSDVVSTHFPPQFVCPGPHDESQLPALQTSAVAQAWPHAPQFAGSDVTSTHSSPHFLNPEPHVKPHVPPEQTAVPFAGTEHVAPQ